MRLYFLGTGASGGTPGQGYSRRRESSLYVCDGAAVLLDVTRDFSEQSRGLERIDAILLTHGHRDAVGGLPQLRRWWHHHGGRQPIHVILNRATAEVIRTRYRRLEHCRFDIVTAGEPQAVADLTIRGLPVPHSRDTRFETFAWRISSGETSLVYASDIARLTPELERFCKGANILVLDGAMWRRRLFSHLTIDQALPQVCGWAVTSVVLTQIGRTAPPHAELQRQLAALCPRAHAARDGEIIDI